MRRAGKSLWVIALVLRACMPQVAMAGERHAVTFILGADHDNAGYFTAAAAYFRTHAQASEEVVPGLRTLAEVREYLARTAMRGDAPWGTIRLVAHGSEWYGLRVPIFVDDAGDATLAALERAASSGEFPALEHGATDLQTRFVIESCGIARRPKLEQAVATLFFGKDGRPIVEASREYVAFRAWTDAAGVVNSERVELPYAALVTNSPTTDIFLRARLRKKLEQAWAYESGHPAGEGLVMHEIPIEVRQLALDTASLSAPVDTLRETLNDLGLKPDQLRWSRENGMRIGRARIVTLSPITEDWVLATGH